MEFLDEETVDGLHEIALEIGEKGNPGVLDRGLVSSAVMRPQNLWAYGGENDPFKLAATLCYGIAKNHGYQDANKRTAALAAITFLDLNGFRIVATDLMFKETIIDVVKNDLTLDDLADWFRAHTRPNA